MLFGSAAAIPIEVSRFVDIRGEGIVDHSITLQTDHRFEGQKFNADMYTPSLGKYGISYLNYTEEIHMVLDNETMIEVVGGGTVINTKTAMGIKNYDMGVSACHKIRGDYILDYDYLADSNITARYLDGKVDGKGDISVLMRNSINRTHIVQDRTQFDGNFNIRSEIEISQIEYPALDTEADYLGCP